MNHPSAARCFYGCKPRIMPNGQPERFKLNFFDYMLEEKVPDELMATWKRGHETGDLWHKYNRAWLKRKEAINQGVAK